MCTKLEGIHELGSKTWTISGYHSRSLLNTASISPFLISFTQRNHEIKFRNKTYNLRKYIDGTKKYNIAVQSPVSTSISFLKIVVVDAGKLSFQKSKVGSPVTLQHTFTKILMFSNCSLLQNRLPSKAPLHASAESDSQSIKSSKEKTWWIFLPYDQ